MWIFYHRLPISLVIYVTVVWMAVACSGEFENQTSFSPVSESKSNSSGEGDAAADTVDLHEHVEIFTVKGHSNSKQTARPVHMLWVFDNSDSMAQEIGAVRSSLRQFVDDLKQATSDLKVTMITEVDTDYGMNSAMLRRSGVHLVRHKMLSYSQVMILASYLMPERFEDYKFIVAEQKPAGVSLSEHQDADFFNSKDALKIFVVVTDEPEIPCLKSQMTLPSGNRALFDAILSKRKEDFQNAGVCFIDLLKDFSPDLSSFRFFSFIDRNYKSRVVRAIDRQYWEGMKMSNDAYKFLPQNLGGGAEQISGSTNAQWKRVLNRVKNEIVPAVLQRKFSLKHPVSKVLELRINDEVLEKNYYRAFDGKIHISYSHMQENDVVKVKYLSEDE